MSLHIYYVLSPVHVIDHPPFLVLVFIYLFNNNNNNNNILVIINFVFWSVSAKIPFPPEHPMVLSLVVSSPLIHLLSPLRRNREVGLPVF